MVTIERKELIKRINLNKSFYCIHIPCDSCIFNRTDGCGALRSQGNFDYTKMLEFLIESSKEYIVINDLIPFMKNDTDIELYINKTKDEKESIDDEKEIMNAILKDLYECNENVSGTWKLVSSNELGDRNNQGKLRWSLLDMKTLEGLVKVLMMGAEKYSDYNWQKGLPINEVYESLMRHLVSFMNGEDNDSESGLSHLDHALCNIYFMKWFMDNKPEMDNRRKKQTK